MYAGQPVGRHHLIDRLVVLSLDVAGRKELEDLVADSQPVAGRERLLFDALIVDVSAVLALQINDSIAVAVGLQPRVTPRHAVIDQRQVAIDIAADGQARRAQFDRPTRRTRGVNLHQAACRQLGGGFHQRNGSIGNRGFAEQGSHTSCREIDQGPAATWQV